MQTLKYSILILGILSFAGCEKMKFEPVPGGNPEALFEELWSTFDTDYAPFEERGVDWQEQYDLYRPQVDASTSEEELAEIFRQMLRSLDDGHVSLTLPGEPVYYSNLIIDQRIDHELFDLELVKSNYLEQDFQESGNGGNTYGWIGNIGYLHLAWTNDNLLSLSDILDYFDSADGLIFDLRHNGGGNFTYALSEFGRLTDARHFVFRSKTKNGKGKDDYTDWYDWYVEPAGKYFDKRIVLLTDRYTISAGERMAMAFKALPNVVHLGDTTNGSIGTKIGKELSNGWYYSVVTQKVEFLDGLSYEGPGIPPDIFVKNTAAEMAAGIDQTLATALAEF